MPSIFALGLLAVVLVAVIVTAVVASTRRTPAMPAISSFTANVHHICSGGALTLSWSATGSTAGLAATLQSGQSIDTLGGVGLSGSMTVHPRATQTGTVTLTLTVSSSGFPSVSQSLQVQVIGPDGAQLPPLPALNIRCGVQESGAARAVESDTAVTVPLNFAAWEGANTVSDWDGNLLVWRISLGAGFHARPVFIRHGSVVMRVYVPGNPVSLEFLGFSPTPLGGQWTQFTPMEPGEACGGSTSSAPPSSPPPMSIVLEVRCPS